MNPDLPSINDQLPKQYSTKSQGFVAHTEKIPTPSRKIIWQEFFNDPILLKYIDQAITNNRDLRLAILKVEEARAAYGIQKSASFPTIAAGLTNVRLSLPQNFSLLEQPSVASINFFNVGFSSWEIDFWGRVRSLKQSALNNYFSIDASRRAALLSLIAEVSNQYLIICELNERLSIAKAISKNRSETLSIYKMSVDLGASSKLELIQAEILEEQAKQRAAQVEQLKALHLNAFSLLIGSAVQFVEDAPGPSDQQFAKDLDPGLPSDLLTQRPDILAAENLLQSANAIVGVARAAFFPNISLTAMGGFSSAELNNLFTPTNQFWAFVPSISMPIFTAGKLKSNLDIAQIRKDQAIVNYEKSIQNAFRDVEDALAAKKWLAEQVQSMDKTVLASQERTRLIKIRYKNGASRYSEYLDAERDDLNIQQQLIQLRRARKSADIALFAALGGEVVQANDIELNSSKDH